MTPRDMPPVVASSAGPERQRSRHQPIGVVLLCAALALLDGADAQSLAIAAPLIARSFGMSSTALGLTFSMAALGSALGYLGGGFVADRKGAHRVVLASAAIIGLFQLSTAFVTGTRLLVAVRFVVAVGLGGAVPGLIALVSQAIDGRARDRLLGLIWACFPLGVLAGSLLNGWLLQLFDWRAIFLVGGVAPLLLAVIIAVTALQADPTRHVTARTNAKPAPLVFRGHGRPILLAALVFFFANGAVATVMNWTPSLLARAGYGAQTGAQASAFSALGALISMALTGFLVARSRLLPIIAGFAIGGLALAVSAAFLHHLAVMLAATVVLGAALGLTGTAATFLPAAFLPPVYRARGLGLGMAVGRIGQMSFPALAGLLLEGGTSPQTALLLIAVLPVAGLAASLALAAALRPPAGASA